MTDDEALVARLREFASGGQLEWGDEKLAADRIEALSKELDEARALVKTMEAENEVRLPLIARLQAEMGERGVRMQEDAREFNALEAKLQAVRDWRTSWLGTRSKAGKSLDAILDGKETS